MVNYFNPVNINFGINEINKISNIIKSNSKILLLTGKNSLKNSGKLSVVLNLLKEHKVYLCNKVNSNPDMKNLYDIKNETDNYDYDYIVAVGGGSVLDIGKALKAFKGIKFKSLLEMIEKIKCKEYALERSIFLIAIPTTAGTGSEVTSWSTIWDTENKKKYSIEDIGLYPNYAIIDATMTLGQNKRLTASTVLDSLCHAVEAYWSKKTNEIVRMYSLKSINLICTNILDLLDDLGNIELRNKILMASMFSGLAFSNTKTTACHSISYPLTINYNIEHGIAASITLFEMICINWSKIIDRYSFLNSFNVSELNEIEHFIERVFQKAGISKKLRSFGVEKNEISIIVSECFTQGRINNNPIELNSKDITNILYKIY
ncbi:iron-containing alcohol dehydrogenase family protein [Clostridium argentinense CDC 2741]|uniref:Iron-containing alcohol dehydrogenase family protein n=1 Tax=Clostridium argentinense CDC 2741 TaxID=1418104 RepID=A0A0C1U5T2_9CLOT|nr:phosphonoacetaldehyde reductase [Clostridium argentinense]ARC85317.1 hypothetical protein RSJ17_12825 [Clostridium argentinense]KIE47113.1 iron-containing alcohol dehydrogenase family protein [Clostridium argentinense CDC 2741]NFF40940.1 phosphonoacetaldehyde reductase [Clostridium argentinense]NFP51349.1 phosphonoacetaldehyde reductase [Clostridium argentinense]NFP73387.1 phosphonoacetaldehyde reductase [Clostridium argentinense]